jgi:hypothetical protein
MGQETGLTAVSTVATLYFVAQAGRSGELGPVVVAAFAAAVGALAREYGCIIPLCGLVYAARMGVTRRKLIVFGVLVAFLIAPWYVRNWLRTGNPFFSNPVGSLFPVNPVYTAILRSWTDRFGFAPDPVGKSATLLGLALAYAPVPVVLGTAAGVWQFRKHGALLVVAGVFVLIWLYSVPLTSGGPLYSMRVLSPALVLLALLAGMALDEAPLSRFPRQIEMGLLILGLWGVLADTKAPGSPFFLSETPAVVEPPKPAPVETVATRGVRILSDNAYTFVTLRGQGFEVVPVWSPEVRFLFEPGLSAAEARTRLHGLGIHMIEYDEQSANARFLQSIPVYDDRERWQSVKAAPELFVLPD